MNILSRQFLPNGVRSIKCEKSNNESENTPTTLLKE